MNEASSAVQPPKTNARVQDLWERLAHRIDTLPRPVLVAVVALIPLVITYLMVTVYLHSSLLNYVPSDSSDTVAYWHETATFIAAGFNGGYYSSDEQIAHAAFTHFDAHGPAFPALLGTLARFTGWGWASITFFNLAFLTIGLLFFIHVARLDNRQVLLTGAVVATSWYVLLYLPPVYQEAFHYGIALTAAGLFYVLFSQDGRVSRRWQVLVIVFLVLVSLVRASWALLFPPLFILTNQRRTPWRTVGAIAVGVGMIGIIYFVGDLINAPGAIKLFTRIEEGFQVSLMDGTIRVVGALMYNIQNYFHPAGIDLSFAQQIELIGVIVLGLVGRYRYARGARRRAHENRVASAEMVFHFYNLLTVLFLALATYVFTNFHRVFAVQILLSVLLLVAFKRYRVVLALVAFNVLVIGSFFSTYSAWWSGSYAFDQTHLTTQQQEISRYLAYDAGAPTPWCNTVVISPYDYRAILIPPGLGISFLTGLQPPQFPLKSRYLLLEEAGYNDLKDKLHVDLIASTAIGNLYLNRDAQC